MKTEIFQLLVKTQVRPKQTISGRGFPFIRCGFLRYRLLLGAGGHGRAPGGLDLCLETVKFDPSLIFLFFLRYSATFLALLSLKRYFRDTGRPENDTLAVAHLNYEIKKKKKSSCSRSRCVATSNTQFLKTKKEHVVCAIF